MKPRGCGRTRSSSSPRTRGSGETWRARWGSSRSAAVGRGCRRGHAAAVPRARRGGSLQRCPTARASPPAKAGSATGGGGGGGDLPRRPVPRPPARRARRPRCPRPASHRGCGRRRRPAPPPAPAPRAVPRPRAPPGWSDRSRRISGQDGARRRGRAAGLAPGSSWASCAPPPGMPPPPPRAPPVGSRAPPPRRAPPGSRGPAPARDANPAEREDGRAPGLAPVPHECVAGGGGRGRRPGMRPRYDLRSLDDSSGGTVRAATIFAEVRGRAREETSETHATRRLIHI